MAAIWSRRRVKRRFPKGRRTPHAVAEHPSPANPRRALKAGPIFGPSTRPPSRKGPLEESAHSRWRPRRAVSMAPPERRSDGSKGASRGAAPLSKSSPSSRTVPRGHLRRARQSSTPPQRPQKLAAFWPETRLLDSASTRVRLSGLTAADAGPPPLNPSNASSARQSAARLDQSAPMGGPFKGILGYFVTVHRRQWPRSAPR
ncbi:hypothetical protein M885DRAFT_326509 [Pelagophyceae sp. CCMP2097]|nr:hypothetical protein M885DRAFT_326509 [Pelagophyceae sp. CCMP2097]